jgi:hypothetical protein
VAASATDFGASPVGTPVTKNLTVTNIGVNPITVNNVFTVSGADAAEFGAGPNSTCGTPISRGGTCVLSVTWTPVGLAGPRTASLDIN